jgi:hypothetical protein
LKVIEHVRWKYACRACQEHVSTAAPAAKPIERGLPGPGLLAQVAVGKFSDHLPLCRCRGSTTHAPTRIAEYAVWSAERMMDGLHDPRKKVGVVVAAQEAAGLDLGAPAADHGQGVVIGVDGVQVDCVELL